jgi:hypothetical protein
LEKVHVKNFLQQSRGAFSLVIFSLFFLITFLAVSLHLQAQKHHDMFFRQRQFNTHLGREGTETALWTPRSVGNALVTDPGY